jgi:ribonuclease D
VPGTGEARWIDRSDALDGLVAELTSEPLYALDTEFHGERTYYPRLALVQVAWPSGVALVDPLAVDPSPLGAVLAGPGVMVAHAADQDLGILQRACGHLPSSLFDTQVAAGFVGLGSPSLAQLVQAVLGRNLAKGDRLTDWTRRPLNADQRAYAAADVEHLLDLHRELVARLGEAGRLQWALDECELVRTYDRGPRDPETSWWRLKGSRSLRGKTRGVAQTLAAWRERAAAAADRPARFVLPDLALAGIVHRPPRDLDELASVRGLDSRHLRGATGREILAAVEAGLALPADRLRLPARADIDRSLLPAVTILLAWTTQRAAELGLDPALLATRADLEALLNGGPDARLASGWRNDVVAEPLRRLLSGEAVVALVDGGRGIELQDRSPPA